MQNSVNKRLLCFINSVIKLIGYSEKKDKLFARVSPMLVSKDFPLSGVNDVFNAILVKGIVALLIRVLSGHTPEEIIEADLHFIDDIHLREHLSPTRSNGLVAMIKQMRLYALAFKTKMNL